MDSKVSGLGNKKSQGQDLLRGDAARMGTVGQHTKSDSKELALVISPGHVILMLSSAIGSVPTSRVMSYDMEGGNPGGGNSGGDSTPFHGYGSFRYNAGDGGRRDDVLRLTASGGNAPDDPRDGDDDDDGEDEEDKVKKMNGRMEKTWIFRTTTARS